MITAFVNQKELLAGEYSDVYKSIHGIRPRWVNFSELTEEQIESELEQLYIEAEESLKRENELQEQAAHQFEMQLQSLLMDGAKDREMAIRWMHESENTGGDDNMLCYVRNLPYGYFNVKD